MKILQLVTRRQYRGAEVFAANLSDELIKLNHQIIFVGLYKNPSNALDVAGATNIDLVENNTSLFSIQVLKRLRRIILQTKPDIIQCNGSDTLKYMVAVSVLIPKVPILYRNISIISKWVSKGVKRQMYKLMFKKIHHVTSVGKEAIKDFIQTFDYPVERTTIIRRGIPVKVVDKNLESRNLKSQLKLKNEDKIVIHIGNFSEEKNHEFLLDIFEDVKNKYPSLKLVCVGDGVLFNHIYNEIIMRKLDKTVFLLGFRKDIPELLSASDCFVLTSKVEGVPGVILEAGAQEVPSIATDVGGVWEVLKNGKTGYLVKNFDQECFKETMLKVIFDTSLKNELGTNAHNLVKEDYNPRTNALKFEKLYFKLIDEVIKN